jgi:protein-disulfide isomerase
MGPSNAAVEVLEFADFECPYCRSMNDVLRASRLKHPEAVAVTFVHFPLPGHRFAQIAARAAECAAEQERFEAMHDQLFTGQDSFGLVPWTEFANRASIPDVGQFERCIKETEPPPRIDAGKALGQKLGLRGTPTLIVNGWMLSSAPSLEELEQMIENVAAGKPPVSTPPPPATPPAHS